MNVIVKLIQRRQAYPGEEFTISYEEIDPRIPSRSGTTDIKK